MDILQLKYFCEVAESLHVTNTANKLHVAQPALTQTIRRLESELGVKLFKSRGRNIVLTEYGQFLKDEMSPFISKIDELPAKIEELAMKNRNSVRVNVMAASETVISAIVDFMKLHEDVKIKIVQNKEDKEADISVYTLPVYKAKKPDEDTSVFGEEIFLAVPDNDEFRDIDDVDLYDVRGQEFISLAGSKQFRAICDSFCVAAGFKPNIVFESDSPKMVREMIEMGFGIGFWPEYSWGDVVGEKIKLLPITYPVCKRDIIVSCDLTAHSGNDEIVQELKDHIVDCFNNRKK